MLDSTIIYLMRHGLDDETFVGGWSNGGLIKEGKEQVECATKFISQNINDISTIYHSGLNRAIETADIVNEVVDLPIISLDDLKELNKGRLNGMEVNVAKNMYPNFFPNPSIYEKYPDGESLQDLHDRVKSFLKNSDEYDKSLLVTHRGVINMIYFILNDIEINYDKKQFDVGHGSIHKIELGKINKIF